MGVSTQYLIMTPWDQEVIVFEQNVVVGDRSDVGDPVVVHWSPRHTFGLDGSAGTTVGVDPEVLALEALNTGLLDEAPEA
jgi:spermidine/putrescine transport system ATP-binding protein